MWVFDKHERETHTKTANKFQFQDTRISFESFTFYLFPTLSLTSYHWLTSSSDFIVIYAQIYCLYCLHILSLTYPLLFARMYEKKKNRNLIDIGPTERNGVYYICKIHRYLFQAAACLYRLFKGSIWKKETTTQHSHSLQPIFISIHSFHSCWFFLILLRPNEW